MPISKSGKSSSKSCSKSGLGPSVNGVQKHKHVNKKSTKTKNDMNKQDKKKKSNEKQKTINDKLNKMHKKTKDLSKDKNKPNKIPQKKDKKKPNTNKKPDTEKSGTHCGQKPVCKKDSCTISSLTCVDNAWICEHTPKTCPTGEICKCHLIKNINMEMPLYSLIV